MHMSADISHPKVSGDAVILPDMELGEGKHVFVSYVREDDTQVDELCAVLEAAQIPYWRDRKSLGPGDAWKSEIRKAIQSGSLVFLACFSDNSRAKDVSHMNEELTLAVDEYRKRPPGRPWFIPVRFDAGDIPDWDLGAGRQLGDLNYVDLFGKSYATSAASLVTTVHNVMGEKRLSPAAALEVVENAHIAERVDMLKQLTKEMLVDPARRIELDELIAQEVQRVLAMLKDGERVSGPLGKTDDERVDRLASESEKLWEQVEPFCASLQVAARWGDPDSLTPWANGLRSFVQAATKPEGGISALVDLRHLPGMIGLMTAGIASISSRRWANLKTLVVDPSIRDRYESRPLALVEATDFYKPFDDQNWTSNTLARAAKEGVSFTEAYKDFIERRVGKFHTPVAEWLYIILQPIFADQLPDEDTYAAEFDRAEVMLGVLAQDLQNVRKDASTDDRRWNWTRSSWFGRSTWRASHSYGNPVSDFRHELATEGRHWSPLNAQLFGGEEARASAALENYGENFEQLAKQRSF